MNYKSRDTSRRIPQFPVTHPRVPFIYRSAEQNEPEPVVDGDICISNTMESKKDLLCVKYTPAFEFLAAGFNDGQIGLFNVQQGKKQFLMDDDVRQSACPITDIKHRLYTSSTTNSKTITATYIDGRVKCWDYSKNSCIYTIHEHRNTLGLTYHHSMPKFVTVGDDAKIFLYDEETKMQENVFRASDTLNEMDGHMSRIFSASFHPRLQNEFISGGWDNTVQFWDIRQPDAVRHIYGPHICGDGLDISIDGQEILTCAWQKEKPLQLWDYSSGKLIANVTPDFVNSKLYCGKWIKSNLIICGGSEDNIVRIIDRQSLMTMASIKEFSRGVYSVDFGEVIYRRKKRLTSAKGAPVSNQGNPYKFAFCASKKIYECDFT